MFALSCYTQYVFVNHYYLLLLCFSYSNQAKPASAPAHGSSAKPAAQKETKPKVEAANGTGAAVAAAKPKPTSAPASAAAKPAPKPAAPKKTESAPSTGRPHLAKANTRDG